MHMITVSFGSSSCPLLFKTPEAAQAAWEKLMPAFQSTVGGASMEEMRAGAQQPASIATRHVFLQDDFGRQLYVTGNDFHGAIIEDMASSAEGTIEIGLHHTRTQIKANQRGQADPVISSAQRLGGPSVISPMMNGNGRAF